MTYRSMILASVLLVSVLAGPAMAIEGDTLKTAAIFGDHMVVQAGKPIPVWGWAKPGATVRVKLLDAKSVTAMAGKDGRWMAKVSPVKTGQTGTMTISTDEEKIVIKDVLVGEVWLCSGQSNMEWTVAKSNNAKEEAAAANYPQIRMFTVTRFAAGFPETDVQGKWEVCSPETVGGFSAAGYFFGREIYNRLKVPVGLIHSSWGGTPVESWMPITSLKGNPLYKDIMQRYAGVEKALAVSDEKKNQARAEYAKKMKAYQASVAKREYPNKGFEQGLAKASYDDASWKSMKIPSAWEKADKEMNGMDGVVWFRKTVTVPADWVGKDLSLKVGTVDDYDVTYFNGQKVGEINEGGSSWKLQRDYTVPGKLVKAGKNTIAVRVLDTRGGGGIWGGKISVSVKGASAKPISLAGAWKYKITLPVRPLRKPGNPFNLNGWTPSGLYNGMIYPLAPYPIQGAIWYQGESNAKGAGRSKQYGFLFPQMIRDWRTLWQDEELSFFYVELANYQASYTQRAGQPGANSTWAVLRQSQREALKLPRTGMGTAIDIGEAKDIHPRNKQDVGKRLALSALAVEYGKPVVHKGPLLKSATPKGDTATLVFVDVAEGLKAETLENCFGVKAADGTWTWADAKIVGKDTIVLKGTPGAKIVAVSYAWADNPAAPLYNSSGIPAVPFNTESKEAKK